MENCERSREFAKRLKYLRKRNRLEMYKLAELCGLSDDMIRKYETGEVIPRSDSLEKIADYFGVTMDYLWGLSEEP